METKHTKGEWSIIKKGNNTLVLCMTDNAREHAKRTYGWYGLHKICLYGDGLNQSQVLDKDKYEAEANAKLIAAAPELLDALIELEKELDRPEFGIGTLEFELWKICNNAIKKATE